MNYPTNLLRTFTVVCSWRILKINLFFEFAKSKIAVTCKSIQGKDYIIVILSGKELNIPIDLIVNLEKAYSPVFINRVNETYFTK